ncbi:hypothetical protein [Mycobacterium deserti]|uniref:Uncharacterized protein n=1 Tax=Mycobacterium deserti TaxID=2978347 RepID=A0ABT2M9E6_9MYCO|nr:hypothetical protein [Mycobacterium deserti]MCT7658877.1 hypothetical protein [Mycobacterium deserti]
MNTLSRLRRAEKRVLKAQRRVWLLQAAFWPTVVLAGLGAAGLLAVRLRSRSDGPAQPVDGLPHL